MFEDHHKLNYNMLQMYEKMSVYENLPFLLW